MTSYFDSMCGFREDMSERCRRINLDLAPYPCILNNILINHLT